MTERIELPMLDDPLVRKMAEQDHVPREAWTVAGRVAYIVCCTCGQEWPCATRQALSGGGS